MAPKKSKKVVESDSEHDIVQVKTKTSKLKNKKEQEQPQEPPQEQPQEPPQEQPQEPPQEQEQLSLSEKKEEKWEKCSFDNNEENSEQLELEQSEQSRVVYPNAHNRRSARYSTAINFKYNDYRDYYVESTEEDLLKILIVRSYDKNQRQLCETLKQTLRAMNLECNFPETKSNFGQDTKPSYTQETRQPYTQQETKQSHNYTKDTYPRRTQYTNYERTERPRFGRRNDFN